MNNNNEHKIPLGELIEILRENGYEFTIEQILEIQSALLSTNLIRLDAHQLKYILTPIIANNEEEQHDIHLIIDAYVNKKTKHRQKSGARWMNLNRKQTLWLKFIALLLVIIAGIAFYFYTNTIENKSQPVTSNSPVTIADTIAKKAGAPSAKQETIETESVLELNSLDVTLTSSHGALPPNAINFNLETSLALGIIMGVITAYLIFYEKKRMMGLQKQNKSEEISAEHASSTDEAAETGVEHVAVQFPEQDFLIHKSSEFPAIRSNLKRPAPVGQVDLDLEKTILKTARNAGFTSLVYNDEWKDRKYLILTEDADAESHISHLFNHLIHFLKASRVPFQHHSFTTNISTLEIAVHITEILRAGRAAPTARRRPDGPGSTSRSTLIVFQWADALWASSSRLKRDSRGSARNWR